jgi:deoxycytidylate deaminase
MINYGYTLLDNPHVHDIEGLRDAYTAAQRSDHPRTQVGAILGSAAGANNKADYRDKYPEDVEFSRLHAEVAVIINSSVLGQQTRAFTMYAPWACCTGCASAILKAGIPRVVVHHNLMQMTAEKWKEEVMEGVDMLLRNNVRVEAIAFKFGVEIRFDGKEVVV